MSTATKEKELTRTERANAIGCPRCGALGGEPCTLVGFKHLEPRPAERERYEMRTMHRERYLALVGEA